MPPGLSEIASPGTLQNFDLDSLRADAQKAGLSRTEAKFVLVEYHKYHKRDLHRETVDQFLAQFGEPTPGETEEEATEA